MNCCSHGCESWSTSSIPSSFILLFPLLSSSHVLPVAFLLWFHLFWSAILALGSLYLGLSLKSLSIDILCYSVLMAISGLQKFLFSNLSSVNWLNCKTCISMHRFMVRNLLCRARFIQSLERQRYWNPSPEQIHVTQSSVSRNKENKGVKLLK